jgi:hypothetical protein
LSVQAIWSVQRTRSPRFPFRVAIEQDGRTILAVRAASPWPGPGQQVFCIREDTLDADESLEPVEQAPVLSLSRLGRKLAIVLDRPLRKRCEFLFIDKPRRDGSGTYEQVFFRTESGIRSHRSRTRLEIQNKDAELHVVIDSGEKYPWRFPGAELASRKLPAGDYALLDGERIAAVVERKSFDNLLADLGQLQALHHSLAHLERYERAALVVEAQYADFLDEKRLTGRWPAAFVARALAEVAAMHPRLPMVFCGNRKLANQWTYRFFLACANRQEVPQLEFVREGSAADGPWERPLTLDEQVRAAVMSSGTGPFAISELAGRIDGATVSRVRRVLQEMQREGKVHCLGRGRGPRWELVG